MIKFDKQLNLCFRTLIKIIMIVIFITVAFPKPGGACYSARPMGMGGAYVALAQGTEGLYWNPGGMVFSQGSTFHTTQSLPPENINYQSFLGGVLDRGNIAVGLGYTGLTDFAYDRYWLQTAFSFKVLPWLGVGVGKRLVQPWRGDTYHETDLGVQVRLKRVSLGVLLQSVDTVGYNIRSGIALHGEDYTLAVDVYDFTNNHEAFSANLGFEYRPVQEIGLRLGLYRLGSDEGYVKTVGIGKKSGSFALDTVYLLGSDFFSLQVSAGYNF